ncbi:hypothetical protein B0T14DRAFT_500085 [Immersiella caudata]|uniref:Uncharacterized protein n=1 Tax=Immersiella caudata TaxID=314043 RepID=A0AA39WBW0_9PEZI|nr:hypothetical protein B0T14DRAFT_500085 [Immersiella caudata]
MWIPTVTTAVSGLLVASIANANPTPPAPSLSYLGTLNLTLAPPIAIGVGPLGDRNFFAITGGSFTGPVLSATVPPVGGDWGLGHPSVGAFKVEARYHLRTSDGANIYGQSEGPQQEDLVSTHTRIKWETGHPRYEWVNKMAAVGIGSSDPELKWTAIEMWKVEGPKREGKGRRRK